MTENKKTLYKILTPQGWADFEGIQKLPPQSTIDIILENNVKLNCTKDHKIFISKTEYVLANSLKVGDCIYTIDGLQIIKEIKDGGIKNVYDIIESKADNQFYTNGILVHNCEFIGKSNSLIDAMIMRQKILDLENVSYKFVIDSDVRFYKDIEPYKKYLIAIDTSMGVDGDFAAIQVFEFPGFVQVAEWQSDKLNQNLQVEKLKSIAEWIYSDIKNKGNRYPEIYWSLENNTSGEGFICALRGLGGPEYIKRATLISEYGNKRIGFTTTKSNKPAACSQLKILFESNKLKINSRDCLIQLSNFSAKEALSYSASGNGHDDLITSMLVIIYMWLQSKDTYDLNSEIMYNQDTNNTIEIIDDMPFLFTSR